jgi:RNase H-like domain found in reverse transcriptase/Integrase zinc binding domain
MWQFILETDASGFALRAVISQEFTDGIHPIGFYSCSLQPTGKNYDVHDKELTAIVFGFKCGCPFFLGAQHTIKVQMNHKNLQYFYEPQKVTRCQAHWITFLQDFTYTLMYVAGHENTIANLLSRCMDLNKGVNTNQPHVLLLPTLFSKIYDTNPLMNWKTFLDDNPETRWQILQQLHDSPIGTHPGISNTWDLVKWLYEGPRLREFIEEYVKGCVKCQESKTNLPQSKAPLQHFDTHVEEGPFQYVSMDLSQTYQSPKTTTASSPL